MRFPFYKQIDSKDCGPTCLKIVLKYYGRKSSIKLLRNLCETTRVGSSLMALSNAAEEVGFRSLGAKLNEEGIKDAKLPCILFWEENHFVVLYRVKKNKYYISDPARNRIVMDKNEFLENWLVKGKNYGIGLLLEPTPKLYDSLNQDNEKGYGFNSILKYLVQYKAYLWQLILGLLAGSLLQLVFPFLTQSLVDTGIKNQDLDFIYLILAAQLFLFVGKASVELIRSWILLHLSTRINISMISDFFVKLMNLPIEYFDVKLTGDLLQRINDHERIEKLLTTKSLGLFFSVFTLVFYCFVIAYYSISIFGIFVLGSFLYISWILFFLKKRKELDYARFEEVGKEQSKVIEIINGMQEIKLHNAERLMRWDWEYIQAKLFKVSIKNLTIEQAQGIGSNLINEFKNIIITVVSAKLVVDGNMTLGMLLAISYILGQANMPILQLVNFIRDFQDAKISLERLGEIHNMPEEDALPSLKKQMSPGMAISLRIENLSYRYPGMAKKALANLSLIIPAKKTTAIVGASGSGKTTLMKILLGFYTNYEGKINVNNIELKSIPIKNWRNQCGVVMQEGYLFNKTIEENIILGHDEVDSERLNKALKLANIDSLIEDLPQGILTKIGSEGMGLSSGQKQRLLIARAIYKNPEVIFFDEATSALDATNELTIMENLYKFFERKTVVVIAHRLSTVKNADQIVVLENGAIVEIGMHEELKKNKESYFRLVQNQLDVR